MMLPGEYETMFAREDSYWWYEGLRRLVLASLADLGARGKLRILDAGCGTGGLLGSLPDGSWGVDIADTGIRYCRRRGLSRLVQSSVTRLPFRAGAFDAVISLDVLYHQWVADDLEGLREFRRVLVPGGTVIVNLPAYEFMRSEHDAAILTRRRYTRAELAEKLRASGFRPVHLTYRNTVLFPLALLVRRWRRNERPGAAPRSDLVTLPAWLNRALLAVVDVENWIVRRAPLPFGLSLYCVAQKA